MEEITRKLNTAIEASDEQFICSKRKAVVAFFPYAVWQQREGNHEMSDIFLRLARAAGLRHYMWARIEPFVSTLLHEESDDSLKLAAVLASPHFPWKQFSHPGRLIQLWAAAAATLPDKDEVDQSVVDALLHVAYQDTLREYVPFEMWSWLNKRPSLPPVCPGRRWGSSRDVVRTVRQHADIKTLTSYLMLVWSEWDPIMSEGLEEMSTTIQEVLGGTSKRHHREDLLRHLDRVLDQLTLEHLRQYYPSIDDAGVQLRRDQYSKLREVLVEVGRGAAENSICESCIGSCHSVRSMHSHE